MKKILFGLICFLSLILIPKAAADFVWHNDAEYAYTTIYSGTIEGDVTGTYQNSTIKSKGKNNIELNNFKAFDVMIYEAYTISLSGTSNIDYIEQSSNSEITLTGNGILKVKEVGLSMEDMISKNTSDYQNQVKKYVKGDYTLSLDGDYLVFTTKQEITEKKEETKPNNTTNNNQTTNNTNKEEIEEPEEKETLQKDLSFTDKSTGVTITGNDKIDSDIIFVAGDITNKRKEVISSLTEENIYKVYDFSFQKNNEIVKLEKNIKISIPVETGKEYNVYYYNGTELIKLASSIENNELTFNTNHFSEYVVTTLNQQETDSTKVKETKKDTIEETTKKESKSTYLIIGSIIIVVIIIGTIIISKKRK